MKIYEAVIKPHHGGFGLFQQGPEELVEGIESLLEWEALAAENGALTYAEDEIGGLVYGQCGRLYRVEYTAQRGEVGPIYSYHAVWGLDQLPATPKG